MDRVCLFSNFGWTSVAMCIMILLKVLTAKSLKKWSFPVKSCVFEISGWSWSWTFHHQRNRQDSHLFSLWPYLFGKKDRRLKGTGKRIQKTHNEWEILSEVVYDWFQEFRLFWNYFYMYLLHFIIVWTDRRAFSDCITSRPIILSEANGRIF